MASTLSFKASEQRNEEQHSFPEFLTKRRFVTPTTGLIFKQPNRCGGDACIRDLLKRHLSDTVQAMPDYRGTTTMIVTTDHGRGNIPNEWKTHHAKIAGSDKIWIAVIVPDTPAPGEGTNVAPLVQSQIAATVAALLRLVDSLPAALRGLPRPEDLEAELNKDARRKD